MQIVVVSNLHGNLPALERALTEVERLKESWREIESIYIIGIFGFMPFPRRVMETIQRYNGYIIPVKGKYDQLISKFNDLEEDVKEEMREMLPSFVVDMIQWNRDAVGKEGRNWLEDVPTYISEKFGENEFIITYGDIFKQVEDSPIFDQEELKPKMPLSYYETFLKSWRKYEVAVVGGKSHYVADTRYGKVICPGSAGIKPTRDGNPHFAVIDTVNTDVAFFEFDFKKSYTQETIRKLGLPEETTSLLYHGYHGYRYL